MKHPNKRNNITVTAATSLLTLAIMVAAANMMMATTSIELAAATTTTGEEGQEETTTATTMPASSPSSGLELSPQPVYQEISRETSVIQINQTHIQFAFNGNGTFTLPNTTETINTTSTGSVIVSLVKGTGIGQEVLSTEDGTENANATFFGIARFDLEQDSGKSLITSIINTNSTGRLAPLNGMILVGQAEFPPGEISYLTLWEWQSGIPLPTTTSTTMEGSASPMNTTAMTTTMTNTTTADNANTNVTTALSQEEGGGEQQQQQETTPLAPNPLFE